MYLLRIEVPSISAISVPLCKCYLQVNVLVTVIKKDH